MDYLRAHPLAKFEITGHTDSPGSEEFNDLLSQERASAVEKFLTDAGVPIGALTRSSAGEKLLRIRKSEHEPRNRRVEIHLTSRRPPTAESPPSQEPAERKPIDLFNFSDPGGTYPGSAVPNLCSSKNDCAAVSGDPFDQQPPALRAIIRYAQPARWFADLPQQNRTALTSIFNRLCKFGLLCHIQHVTRVEDRETPAQIPFIFGTFDVPGKEPKAVFATPSSSEFLAAMLATSRFCMATGLGNIAHRSQPSFREISNSDSLHISIGPGNQFDAHIDRYSPAPKTQGKHCSNAATPESVAHITRELFPEILRPVLPGLELFPEPPPRAPVPLGTPGLSPTILGISLRGPRSYPTRRLVPRQPDMSLDSTIEENLHKEISTQIKRDALSAVLRDRLSKISKARDQAGPDEERALIAKQSEAQDQLVSGADAQEFAKDLARRMSRASLSGDTAIAVDLGPSYAGLSAAEYKSLIRQVRMIAVIVRRLLGRRAEGVHIVWVGTEDALREVRF